MFLTRKNFSQEKMDPFSKEHKRYFYDFFALKKLKTIFGRN
jgi:hypothetical protein